eukprot:TRINITY_DN1847_c0_g2_i1.p1 TRINITY_DN1847_c0_g2~~TRINITY_DN1847_c0_g2_i1.p1  ORF type:complete len:963 (-),score=222.50 TRINITY_DN1847_c0_g2_i1:1947-4835(-)
MASKDAQKSEAPNPVRLVSQHTMSRLSSSRFPSRASSFFRRPMGVHELIAARAAAVPDSIAVFNDDGTSYTFGNLVAQAAAVAWYLRTKRDVKPDTAVAVCLPQGFAMVSAMLGIMMSGGCYVYLDPQYPAAHMEYLLSDSQAAAVLVDTDTRDVVPSEFQPLVQPLEDLPALGPAEATEMARSEARAPPRSCEADLMVLLYTSGSTGKPKGVALEHRSTFLHMTLPVFDDITSQDRFAQCCSPGFIGSMVDMWLPLTRGAATAFVPRSLLLDPIAFQETIETLAVSCVFMTPKVVELYSDTAPEALESLRNVYVAGEMSRLDAINALAARAYSPSIFNLYGTTEHNGGISSYQVPRDPALQPQERLPAGVPFDHVKVLLLDETLEPVPAGEEGEICIASPQLARGYWNRPDATAEKFIQVNGMRAYRTGDRGVWRAGGSLEVLGRVGGTDTMVKVAGNRVELAQVEAAALSVGAGQVKAAVATLHKETRLALYYVPAEGATITPRALREELAKVLVDYMCPSYVTKISAVPLSFAGKVDRKSLPEPSLEALGDIEGPELESEAQRTIACVMEDVLGLPAGMVRRDTEYKKDLGGTSLHATILMMQLRRKLCPRLAIVHLRPGKDTPALIEETASRLNSGEAVDQDDVLPDEVQLVADGGPEADGVPPVFAVHGGNGNSPFGTHMANQLKGRKLYAIVLSDAAIKAAQAHPDGFSMGLAVYYTDLVKVVQKDGPYTLTGVGSGALMAFEMARELESRGDEVSSVVILDMWMATGRDFNYRVLGLPDDLDPEVLLVTEIMVAQQVPAHARPDMKAFREELDRAIIAEATDKDLAFEIRMAAIESAITRALGTDVAAVMRKAMTHLRPVYAGHCVDSRRRGRKLDAPIVLVKASDKFIEQCVVRFGRESELEDYGWAYATTKSVSVVQVPGNHVNMTTIEEGARFLADLYTNKVGRGAHECTSS